MTNIKIAHLLSTMLMLASGVMAHANSNEPGPSLVTGVLQADGQITLSSTDTDIPTGKPWQWASVTKQFMAVLIMQDVAAGKIALDATLAEILPEFGTGQRVGITVEMLLRNTSGLAPQDDLPAQAGADPLAFCDLDVVNPPGTKFYYNNCDFMILGEILSRINQSPWETILQDRILAPLGLETTGVLTALPPRDLVEVSGEPHLYGASAAMFGSPSDLLKFDAALMKGKLLSEQNLETLWDGDPSLGYVALGQWAFSVSLEGCEDDVFLIERRGQVGGIQVRNVLAPELSQAFVAFARSEDDIFGEIWMQAGKTYELASQSFCSGD